MPSQIKNAAAVLGTSLTALVSCAAGQQIAITDISALNTSGSGRTINLSLYQQATNTVYPISLPNKALATGTDPYRLPSKIFLTPGDELRASADAASGVVLSVMYAISTSVPQLAKGFLGKGTWASGTTYDLNDVVEDGVNSYISLQKNNVGNTPSTATAYWMVNARRGLAGTNATGDVTGPTASLEGELFVATGTTGKALKRTNIVPTTWGLARAADADQAATRTALGLKGAAYLDVNVASGVLTLDGNAKVPVANLPEAVLGAMKYQSGWNANTNTPALPAPSSANKGFFYLVTVAGTTPLSGPFGTINEWQVGDWAVSDGTYWEKVDSSDQVTRVAGLMGDISASDLKTALAYTFAQINGTIATAQIADSAVTNSKLAQMPALTIKGNNNAAVGSAADLTMTQVKTMLALSVTDVTGAARSADPVLTGRMSFDGLSGNIGDKGTVSSGTVNFDANAKSTYTITNGGAHTWTLSFGPGNSVMEIALTNGGAAAITLPAGILWYVGDGTTSTTFSAQGVTLQASGTNVLMFWSYDGGTTVYGLAR